MYTLSPFPSSISFRDSEHEYHCLPREHHDLTTDKMEGVNKMEYYSPIYLAPE